MVATREQSAELENLGKIRATVYGRKVYIVAALAVALGVYGQVAGEMTTLEAIDYVLGGAGLAAGRAAFAKLEALLTPPKPKREKPSFAKP